ncbi:MAG: carbamoyltransferase [Zetaproteobacteria bacterium]|nr:carbamoyltransferase [Zetaproteobacteria bacterium]
MNILGIYGYDPKNPKRGYRHNGGAALVADDGTVLSAIEEERLSRIKNDAVYPTLAIEQLANEHPFDHIALAGLQRTSFLSTAIRNYQTWRQHATTPAEKKHFLNRILNFYIATLGAAILNLPNKPAHLTQPMQRFHHHDAHAASAYYCCPWPDEDVLIITLDGAGDGLCGRVEIGRDGQRIHQIDIPQLHSIGAIYSMFTAHLGFKPHRHEGKVLGLAAYGNPQLLANKLMAHIHLEGDFPTFDATLLKVAYGRFAHETLNDLIGSLSREDIAAGLQHFTEKTITHFVQHWVRKTDIHKLALAGGVFSNVKLNQRILELECVDNLYIQPNMGDGGLAVGAALAQIATQKQTLKPKFLSTAYLGQDITLEAATAALHHQSLDFSHPTDMAEAVATLLASGKVVARAAGRMEFGPRALGNRTLFASCSDEKINQWLNDKLQRTEFMPFAPIIMEEHAAEYFPAWEPEHVMARFMTITYDASEIARKNIPAAVHVDGTARPQVLREEDNPEVYAILRAYYAKTGVPALINTSFNMHEEPIVCSAADAVRAFQLGHLDALICGPLLCVAKQP